MKKLISIMLAVLLIASSLSLCFSAGAYDDYYYGLSDIPNIYVSGQGQDIVNEDGKIIYFEGHPTAQDVNISDAVNECMPYFKNAIIKGEWDAYTEKLLGIIKPVYEDVKMDENGEPRNGSRNADLGYLDSQFLDLKAANGKYALRGYRFLMDWRLDPFAVADKLNDFIKNVKKTTGKDKVNLISRCEGSNVVAAYLERYGVEDVNCASFYVNTVYGCDDVSAVFSGNFGFDGESMQRFLRQGNYIADETISAILNKSLDLLVETFTYDGLLLAMTPVVQRLYEETLSKVLLHSYGTMPGIWSVVCADEYARAKDYIFAGVEDEYAGLIEKLDYYDTHVRQRADELFKQAAEDGLKIQFVGKYGNFAMWPLTEKSRLYSDGVVLLSHTAPGATTAKFNKTLESKYIQKIQNKGKGQYLSPDKTTDCSTCLFPNTTWVVYNSPHRAYPESIHSIIGEFVARDGNMTVFDDEMFPQYITFDEETKTISPMTEENGFHAQKTATHSQSSIKQKAIEFFKTFIKFILQWFSKDSKK